MGYRSCLGIICLAQQYSAQRMEAAAEWAPLAQACRYQSVKSILKNSLDALPLSPPQPGSPPLTHDNVRGADDLVVPEVVSWEKNGKDAQGVDHSRLTALLIEATKEQQAQIQQ